MNPVISTADSVTNTPCAHATATRKQVSSPAKVDSFAEAMQQVGAAQAQACVPAQAAVMNSTEAGAKQSDGPTHCSAAVGSEVANKSATALAAQTAPDGADLTKSAADSTEVIAKFEAAGSALHGEAEAAPHNPGLSGKREHEAGKKVQPETDAGVNPSQSETAGAVLNVPAVSPRVDASVAPIFSADAIVRPVSASATASRETSGPYYEIAASTRANGSVRAAMQGATKDVQPLGVAVEAPHAGDVSDSVTNHNLKANNLPQGVTEAASKAEAILGAAVGVSPHAVSATARQNAAERIVTAPHVRAPEIALRSIEATAPDRLEVGVTGGTAGWLTVRTQLAQDGTVHAMLRGAAEAATELRAQKSELTEFLSSHGVSVSRLDVEAVRVALPGKVSAESEHFSGRQSESGAQQGQQQPRHERGRMSVASAINPVEPVVVSGIVRTPLFAAMASGVALASTGGWLSVRV